VGAAANRDLATAKHSRWDRLYTELTYLPMQEVRSICVATGSRPTSSSAAARTLCACTPSGCTESRPSRWSAPPGHEVNAYDKEAKPFLRS
jgi:hypothetical protein